MKFYPRLHWLRGFLALSVAASHVGHLVGNDFDIPLIRCGSAAVPLFFVLSGFVMFKTVWKSPTGLAPALGFLGKRVFRIFPAYWFYLALTALFISWGGVTWDHAEAPGKDWAAGWSLLTRLSSPALPMNVAWSLIFELIFYYVLVFAVLNRFLGAFALLIYFGWSLLGNHWSPVHIYGLSPICGLFLSGLLLGAMEKRLPKIRAFWWGLLFFGLAMELEYVLLGLSLHNSVEDFAAILIVAGILGLEICRPPAYHGLLQKALGLLGTISFSLYVGHTIVQSVLLGLIGTPTFFTVGLFVIAPILAAIGTHAWIEAPAIAGSHAWERRLISGRFLHLGKKTASVESR